MSSPDSSFSAGADRADQLGDELAPAAPGSVGRRAFIAGTAGALVGAAVLSSSAAAIEPGASFFQPLDPTRLCDTRPRPGLPGGYGYTRLSDRSIRVKVAGNGSIPADAVAVVLTVTGVRRDGSNWIGAYPANTAFPGTSNVNIDAGDSAVANLVTVKLGGGAVDVVSESPCDLIVDVAGVYRPASGPVSGGRFVALNSVVRPLDTRGGPKPVSGEIVTANLNGLVPIDAVAVVGNLTAVDAVSGGYLTAFPLGTDLTDTSNLNYSAGQTRAAGIITKLGSTSGSTGLVTGIKIFNYGGAHILLDVAGYITGSSAAKSSEGLFVPVTPVRLLDTRLDKKRLWPGWTRSIPMPSPINTRAQAVALNVTATQTGGWGFFTLHATRTPRREVSNLNVTTELQTVANHAISRISSEGVACYSYNTAHMICDLTGWFTGAPAALTTGVPVDPPPPGGPLPWSLNVPRMGLINGVYEGHSGSIVNTGNSWYWTGTGLVGQGAHTAAFGHRTDAGGPYRYQHYLQVGDLLYVDTADRRRYTYRMATEYITSKYASQILAATRQVGGETFSLVACSKTNGLPTDLDYRIVSTFTLVDWVDLG
ncbi:MAG: sortase [Ilumatobacteraceae bacterium]|nr:sortase [Ilumatobacteraceae bacterium]